MIRRSTDVLVIGAGAAGARAALAADRAGVRVCLVAKGPLGRSGITPMAESGLQASFGHMDPRDTPDIHLADMVRGGCFINNQELAEILTKEAPGEILELERYGAVFEKTPEGGFFQSRVGGYTYPRCCWIEGAGAGVMRALGREITKRSVEVVTDVVISRLLVRDGRAAGAVGADLRTGEVAVFYAKAVIVATGGAEEIYSVTDTAPDSTGDGVRLAFQAGAEVVDMEFMQFFPHVLLWPEAVRGVLVPEETYYPDLVGGKLVNGRMEPFVEKYDPVLGLHTTRDKLARAIVTEVAEGRGTPHGGVYIALSLSPDPPDVVRKKADDITTELYRYLRQNGIDMVETPLEVSPAAHFQCGGIKINALTETRLPGLYAAGECAGGIHGANRLSGNALSDTLVFGARAGKHAAEYAKSTGPVPADREIEAQVEAEAGRLLTLLTAAPERPVRPGEVRERLQRAMFQLAGLSRSEASLAQAEALLAELTATLPAVGVSKSGGVYNYEWQENIELESLLVGSGLLVKAARLRTESRGSHYRSDFPEENDREWLANITITPGEEEKVTVTPAVLTKLHREGN